MSMPQPFPPSLVDYYSYQIIAHPHLETKAFLAPSSNSTSLYACDSTISSHADYHKRLHPRLLYLLLPAVKIQNVPRGWFMVGDVNWDCGVPHGPISRPDINLPIHSVFALYISIALCGGGCYPEIISMRQSLSRLESGRLAMKSYGKRMKLNHGILTTGQRPPCCGLLCTYVHT